MIRNSKILNMQFLEYMLDNLQKIPYIVDPNPIETS